MPLVLDERVDRTDEQRVQLVREAQIELLHGVEFQPAPERRDLGDDGTSARGDRAPVEAVGGDGEDIALLLAGHEKKQRLVGREQLLDVLDLQRPRVRQRGVVGEFLLQLGLGGGKLALGVFDLPANRVDLRRIGLPRRPGQRFDQRFRAIPPVGGEVLILAHQRGERIVAAGEARVQLLDGGRRRRLVRPLRDFERLAAQRRRGLDALAGARRQAGNVIDEEARPLLDQSVSVARLGPGLVAEIGMREHRRGRLARIGHGIGGLPLHHAQRGKMVERPRRVRMVGAARLLVDGERPLVGLLGIVVAALVLEQLALVQQHGGNEAVLRAERLGGDLERALELGVGIGVATLRVVGHAELADHLGGVGIVRAEGLGDDGERALGMRFQLVGAALRLVDRRKVVEHGGDIGVIGAERRFPNAQGALVERLRLVEAVLVGIDARKVEQRGGEVRMLRAQRLLPNLDGALEQLVGLGVTAEPLVHVSQVVDARGDVGMVRAERVLADGERAAARFLHLGEAALILVDLGEVVEDQRHQQARRAGGLLRHVERALVLCLGLVIARLGLVDVGEIAHEERDVLIGSALRLGRDLERLLVQFFRLDGIGLQQIHRGQVGERLGQAGIAGREILLQRAEHLLEHPGGLAVAAQRLVGAGQVVQRRDVGEIVGAAALGRRLVLLRLGKRGGIVTGGVKVLEALLRDRDVILLRGGAQRRRHDRNDGDDKASDQSASPSRSHDPLQRTGRTVPRGRTSGHHTSA